MKRYFKYLILAVIGAATVMACEKAQVADVDDPLKPSSEASYDPARYLTGFSVSQEAVTKADLDFDSGVISWVAGDVVKIVRSDGASANYVYNADASKFEPEGEPIEKNGSEMHAFFPADKFAIATDGAVTFTMPAAFETTTGIMNPMAGVVPADATEETVVKLWNLGGIYKVNLSTAKTSGETVTKLELGNTAVNLTGSAPVSFDSDGIPALSGGLGGEKSVSLAFATPVRLSSSESRSVYFFLPASGSLEGMYVKAVFGKTAGSVSYEPYEMKTRNSAMALGRNKLWSMNFSVKGFFSGGDGLTSDTAYEIASADDFKAIKTKMESTSATDGYVSGTGTFFGSEGVYYKQTADIDFENQRIASIGVYNTMPFRGKYDGNNKKLENFSISGNVAGSVGLFTYVNNAKLKRIIIANAQVTGTNTTGILTGRCIGSTIIEDCSLEGGEVTGRNSVGFIAHIYADTKVKNCSVLNLTVTTAESGSDANNQGGVVGYAGGNSSIESCTTSGNIQFIGTASGSARGGIVGKLDSTGSIEECTNSATITNSLVDNTGGIAGALVKGTISNCVNSGNVTGKAYVGGIVGDASGTSVICFVNSCRTNATVSGTANCVGGVIGRALNGVVVNSCYAKGSVSGRYDVGGLVGLMHVNKAGTGTLCRAYMYDCLANTNVTSIRAESGDCRTGGAVGTVQINKNQFVAIDNCGVLGVSLTATYARVGGFVGWTNNDQSAERLAIRNCYTLVSSVPGSSNYGGFVGYAQGNGELRFDYYVADATNSNIASTVTKENLVKTTASAIGSDATCTTFNGNTNYQLKVNGTIYKSSLGWAVPAGVDYPVPGALIALGEEYYN